MTASVTVRGSGAQAYDRSGQSETSLFYAAHWGHSLCFRFCKQVLPTLAPWQLRVGFGTLGLQAKVTHPPPGCLLGCSRWPSQAPIYPPFQDCSVWNDG